MEHDYLRMGQPNNNFRRSPSSIIQHLLISPSPIRGNGSIILGGPIGLSILDQNLSYLTTLNEDDGLIGNSVSGLVYSPAISEKL